MKPGRGCVRDGRESSVLVLVSSLMYLLGKGRGPFLEFLRNLTPMVLMGGISLVMWARLDFGKLDWSNWFDAVVFYLCLFTAVLALFANIDHFLDQAFSPLRFDRILERFKRRKPRKRRLLLGFFVLAWRHQPSTFIEAVVAIVVVYAGVFGGLKSAVSAAVAALQNGIK